VGATEGEVRETILQSALFLGFPRALAAMKLFHAVLKGRGAPHEGEG
jgi:4-carboxymuconolactone decarboxylase